MKSQLSLLLSLLKDFKRLSPNAKGLDRDYITIKSRFEHEGIGFLTITLPSLCDAFDKGISTGEFTPCTSFSRKRGTSLPKFLWGLTSNVFDSKGRILDEPSHESIKMIRELLRLYKKVPVASSRQIILEQEAIETFIKTDEILESSYSLGPTRSFIFDRVSRLILPNLENFEDDEAFRHRNGPGGVYERLKTNQKWRFIYKSIMDGNFDPSHTPFDMLFANNSNSLSKASTPASSCARFVTVPKTSKSVRSITVEPVVNQFLQQGLNSVLRDNITKCSILNKCLDLSDQVKNQSLAMEGSITDEWSTIDLSSASDLLSNELVSLCFKHRPMFLAQLQRSRTPYVDVGKFCLRLRKYAGMGNATTFPVQSIAFSIIGICSILEHSGLYPSYGNVVAAARRVRVFGDDIIIRKQYSSVMIEWLESFHLRVNESKSFLNGYFKESCGLDAFGGTDVTPTYLRHLPFDGQPSASTLSSILSTSNQLWLKGLYYTSTLLSDYVSEFLELPLVSHTSGVLGLHDRFGSSHAHCWDADLQRLVVKGVTITGKSISDNIDGHAALLKFFVTPLIERNDNHLKKSVKRFNSRLRKTKVPAIAERL